jgi:uncharacterized membrane protein YphA (DoxX/SURF4 family)
MATEPAVRRPSSRQSWTAIRPWVTTVVRLGLATVLALAGWAKVTEPPRLQKLAVSSYQILPDGLVSVVGIGLPVLELALAALLVLGFATRLSAAASGLLMIVFIAGIISVWARGLSIDCGCFGGGGTVAAGQTRYLQEILRDTGFLAMAAWIVVLPKSRLALDGLLGLYDDGASKREEEIR